MLNEVRKTLGMQSWLVAASSPALGMMVMAPVCLATRSMPMATPEWTGPMTTSTPSPLTRRLMFWGALDGLASESRVTYSTP